MNSTYSSYLPDTGVSGPITGGRAEEALVDPGIPEPMLQPIDTSQTSFAFWKGDHKVSSIKELYRFENLPLKITAVVGKSIALKSASLGEIFRFTGCYAK